MRKSILLINCLFAVLIISSCGNSSSKKDNENNTDTISENTDSVTIDINDDDFATYYVVVADTGFDYYVLEKKMKKLSKKLDMTIDLMGRYFNKDKNLIALPDNDEDEIYAGDYFPRRFPSTTLSLEYLDFYQHDAGTNTIALVCGIYKLETRADSAAKVIKKTEPKAFVIESEIFIGCMH
ncbi:MAG: hypothetical protein JXR53_13920 [Bacteroidales bacterium]|nr:hypothetical protein [Bacteroidales bacterium]